MENFTKIATVIEYLIYGVIALGILLKIFKDVKPFFNFMKRTGMKKYLKKAENIEKIDRILIEMITKYDAARAVVLLMHNGDYFASGESLEKVTCTNEQMSVGVSELTYEWKNLLLVHTGLLHDEILKNNVVILDAQAENSYNTTWKSFLTKYGISSAIVKKITKKGNPIGFVMIHYDNTRRHFINKINKKEFIDYVNLIEYLVLTS